MFACSFDDILVSGSSESDHLQTLERVLSCLKDSGVKLKSFKVFFLNSFLALNT